MDFFEQQERARKKSGLLVVLFCLAVVGIIVSTYLAVMAFAVSELHLGFWQPQAFVAISAVTVAIVTSGSLYKIAQLSGGGSVVARHLGGVLVDPGSTDPMEHRLLNIVQEMAIASGVPVPAVFVLKDENGINAFAAGHGQGDAVITVTSGAMQKLTRDELQGVIGHEFSHLLNGDMRLNLRLMGIIYGILVIGLIGRGIMRGSRGGSRNRGNAVLLGVALYAIGMIGMLFGNLIKAAVSRQREFLADAASVQFTRNPNGLVHALAKIQGFLKGSRVDVHEAAEASHMFFGDCAGVREYASLSTHPPIFERIARIDPSFKEWIEIPNEFVARPEDDEAAAAGGLAFAGTVVPTGTGALDRIGKPGPEHIERARVLWESVPAPLREAARSTEGAVAVTYALLLAPPGAERERQRALVRERAPDRAEAVDALGIAVDGLAADARLPLIEVAAGALGTLTLDQFRSFEDTVRGLVEGDRVVDLSEWMLSRLLLRQVRERLEPSHPPKPRYPNVLTFRDEVSVLLSALAYAGADDDEEAQQAFAAGVGELGLMDGLARCGRDACPPRVLEAALDTFVLVLPKPKERLIVACAAAVAADGRVTEREAELFRVVADWLGVPVPPLLPGQLLA